MLTSSECVPLQDTINRMGSKEMEKKIRVPSAGDSICRCLGKWNRIHSEIRGGPNLVRFVAVGFSFFVEDTNWNNNAVAYHEKDWGKNKRKKPFDRLALHRHVSREDHEEANPDNLKILLAQWK